MLQDLRENSQGVIAKVIIGFIVAIFALTGVEWLIGGFISSPPVAEINGEEITEAQLQFNTQNLLASLGGADIDQELLEQIALNQLIEETVLKQSADRAGMIVSSDRVDRAIIENPSFQINGVFDSDLAVRTMASQGYNIPLYRQALSQSMLLGQIANAYSASNFITDSELESIAELTQQTRDFRYVSVTMGTRTLGNAISQEEIQRYYDENPAEFTQEESVDVNYVVLDRNVIADEIQVDEAEIRAQYDAQRADFEGSSEKRASHILFEVGGTMDEAAAMDLAATARQRLLDGEDFGAVALELSSDTVSAEEGGDIGYTDGSAFPQPIEAALETLALNEISEPVVTEFGVHVVKLTEDAENVYQAFEEISDRIERELKSAEVDLLFAERIEDMSNLAFETGDLITISEQLGLEIQSADSVPRAGSSGLFANQALVTAAFSDEVMLEGNNSDVIEIGDNQAVVLRVQQFNESAVLPLDDVMGEISIILRTQMEREAVQSLGEDLLIAAEEGGDVDALLADNELEWLDVENISRNDFSVNREVIDHVFTMAAPESEPIVSSVSLANGTFVLVELNQVNPGEFSAIPEPERNRLVDSLQSDLGVSDYQSFLLSLREGSDISAAMLEEVL
ncbi:MAG: SurA N-terminal domain-containing protein [Pseudomonadales bacterium]|nr:SurA N-terminal domain-containing protein [Pseudomonadales bacterium]MBL6816363.1 SurA N-terminal domain-containing protein [Pseudomonadales bacterium]